MKLLFALLISASCMNALANEVTNTTDDLLKKASDTKDQIVQTFSATKDHRANSEYLFLLNYSPIDLIIPSKMGLTLGLINDVDQTWELEYLKGSISVPFIIEDLGKMSDERISLVGRKYFGNNSFNMSYGLSYYKFSMHLGDELLSRISGGSYPSIDLIEVQSLGAHIGIGNRWTFDHNITFGIDWISWSQPLTTIREKNEYNKIATDPDDIDDVDQAIDAISVFPRFSLFKLQFGLLF